MGKDNQDHFKRGGRSGGPPGPRSQHKAQLTRQRATLRRDQEHVLPGERPRAGRRPQQEEEPRDATEEAEAQLASLHGEYESVLDRLPRPVGAAGVPASARPIPTATGEEEPYDEEFFGDTEEEESAVGHAFVAGPFGREVEEEEAPFGYGIPASEDVALGGSREPFARERGEMRHAARQQQRPLTGGERRLVRRLSPVFRVMGQAARVIDRPVRNALDTLQRLGHEARRT